MRAGTVEGESLTGGGGTRQAYADRARGNRRILGGVRASHPAAHPRPPLRSWVYESTAPAFPYVYVVGYSTLAPPPSPRSIVYA